MPARRGMHLVGTPTICWKSFQLLGECHCWWTRESLRAHVAKFYNRLRLIYSVLRASKFSVLKLMKIVIVWVYYTIPVGFSFFLALFWALFFQPFQLHCLAKDHWRGCNTSTRNAHMVHIVNWIRFKIVYIYILIEVSIYISLKNHVKMVFTRHSAYWRCHLQSTCFWNQCSFTKYAISWPNTKYLYQRFPFSKMKVFRIFFNTPFSFSWGIVI